MEGSKVVSKAEKFVKIKGRLAFSLFCKRWVFGIYLRSKERAITNFSRSNLFQLKNERERPSTIA